MKYPEYLSSARRHKQACRVLKEKLDTYAEERENDENYKHLVISLYYLSGYIIECSLKFKIFEVCGYSTEVEIDEDECKNFGINYRKKIRVHCFHKLQNFLDSKVPDISHKSEIIEIDGLLDKWDPIVRYEDVSLNYQDVSSLYDHAASFMRKM